KEGKITLAEVAALCSGCPIGDMVTQIAEKIPDADTAPRLTVKPEEERRTHLYHDCGSNVNGQPVAIDQRQGKVEAQRKRPPGGEGRDGDVEQHLQIKSS
ncbi:MAG: hypothetical protein CVV55_06510, partial [Synergistetes bacterium HGW-Synergistetes-2]